MPDLAGELADVLLVLRAIDPTGGPAPGPHSSGRGGPLGLYDHETRAAIAALGGAVHRRRATAVWEEALGSPAGRSAVWVHGDLSPSNLLASDGHFCAVIDFGCCAVGDPSCDLAIAWTAL